MFSLHQEKDGDRDDFSSRNNGSFVEFLQMQIQQQEELRFQQQQKQLFQLKQQEQNKMKHLKIIMMMKLMPTLMNQFDHQHRTSYDANVDLPSISEINNEEKEDKRVPFLSSKSDLVNNVSDDDSIVSMTSLRKVVQSNRKSHGGQPAVDQPIHVFKPHEVGVATDRNVLIPQDNHIHHKLIHSLTKTVEAFSSGPHVPVETSSSSPTKPHLIKMVCFFKKKKKMLFSRKKHTTTLCP